jgi:hypothetical protein
MPMTESLLDIRARIHQKSHDYFAFAYRRRQRDDWRMFYGATDAILDSSTAAAAFGDAVRGDAAINLLICYGFLQALYIQQDAVWTLSRAVGLKWRPNDDPTIKKIRDIRNRLTGHPSLAGEGRQPKRLSSAIISYGDVRPECFRGFIYYEDRGEPINIHVQTMLRDNEARLALQARKIETEMDKKERNFRSEHSKKLFSNNFGTNFGYLVEKLRCDLSDEGRVILALTHVQMVREVLRRLQSDLDARGFNSGSVVYHFDRIFAALDFMASVMRKKRHSRTDQFRLDLIEDGFDKNLRFIKSIVDETDAVLSAKI